MTALLRDCSDALAAAFAGGAKLWGADLIDIVLADGVTTYHWTTWDSDLIAGDVTYASKGQWLDGITWEVVNTMQVPTAGLNLLALNTSFAGGDSLKSQIIEGLLDGASITITEAYMSTPGDTVTLGVITAFAGVVGGIDLDGATAAIQAKGKTNLLDQYAPRNMYQIGCNHAFCDAGCTLSRASFTSSFTVGSDPTPVFIPWSGTAPGNATAYQNGTLVMTSGMASGSRRTIAKADSTGLTLAYPLSKQPSPGDTLTAFMGCDKTFNSGSGQSCTDYSNTQHYRGFEFIPPPSSAY